jgi:hypothetical protein
VDVHHRTTFVDGCQCRNRMGANPTGACFEVPSAGAGHLGFGKSANVLDFNDGRGMRIRHIARFCETLDVDSAHFFGNSVGAINLLVDAASHCPQIEQASTVNELLLEFLSGTGPTS